MKKIPALLFLTFYVSSFYALKSQNLGTESLLNFGTKGWETISAMASDKDGSYYVAGTFSRAMDINGTELVPIGQRDIFLIKYNSGHQFQWAERYGGGLDDHVYSLACDPSGNLYMAGSFRGTTVNLGTPPLTAQLFTDVFYAQIDINSGQVLTSKALASGSAAKKAVIQVDSDGNIWLAGTFKNNISLDGNTTIQAGSKSDIYLAKYNPAGTLLLNRHISGEGDENLNAFTIDNGDSLFLGGSFDNDIVIGGRTKISKGKLDFFVVKYKKDGARKWFKTGGGMYDDEAKSLSCDTNGNIYVAQGFKYETKIGRARFYAKKSNDVLLIKRKVGNGAIIWKKQLGGDSYNKANSIIAANNGYVYMAGNFTGELQTNVESEGKAPDAFIARYHADGTKGWVGRMGRQFVAQLQYFREQLICLWIF